MKANEVKPLFKEFDFEGNRKYWVYYPISRRRPTTTPEPVETFYLMDEGSNPLLTEGGDNIEYDFPAPTPPFSPTDISNLTNWWESTSGITTDGSGVVSWTDSISSNVATRVGIGFNNTTEVLNGYTGITQTGTEALSLSSTLDLSATTIFIIFNSIQIGGVHYMLGDASSGFFTHFTSPTGLGLYNNPDVAGGGVNTNDDQYGTFIMDATDYYVRQNGSQVDTQAIGSGGNITIDRLFSGNGAFDLNGTIWEILVYDRALNGTEIGQVETYIQNKYGL